MTDEKEVQDKILELVEKTAPETVEALIERVTLGLGISKEMALGQVIDLENQGRLKFSTPAGSIPTELNTYLFSENSIWFWITISLSVATAITVFTIPEKAVPYVYIRYVLGSVFVLLLPGYSLIKTLFPTKEIDNIERTALSIGMSLALVPLVGLLLNYTPWGIRLTPIALSLLSLTLILTITGLIREYQEKTLASF
jgi:hypothetical protein